jgi:phosphoadenosine phosphosulfate reductase
MNPNVEKARITKALRDCPTPPMAAISLIELAKQKFGDEATVSWSGGRCSTVVLHLALQVDPNIRVLFNDTGVEFPETYAFVKKLAEEWKLNLTVMKPETTFWKIVKEYGYPMLRGQYKDNSRSKDGRPMCCQLLKEDPILKAKLRCTITGIRVAESRMRMFAVAQKGQFYFAKSLKRWNFHPIAFWSTEELLKYVEKNKLPMNKVYETGQARCGCWPCTGYIGWRESLAKGHPGMYRFLMKQKGEPTLWEYQEDEACTQVVANI